jgi:hypothetical protein
MQDNASFCCAGEKISLDSIKKIGAYSFRRYQRTKARGWLANLQRQNFTIDLRVSICEVNFAERLVHCHKLGSRA